MAVDAISGAVGEIVQVAALYPLDTIKVRPYPNRAVPYPVGPLMVPMICALLACPQPMLNMVNMQAEQPRP